jgi:NAD(P)-dependent dehydrogenase (short-subunit alcohol dehydrogenase family)
MADPDEVAGLVALLCSPAAGAMTGEAIGVDGGAGLSTLSLTRPRRDP